MGHRAAWQQAEALARRIADLVDTLLYAEPMLTAARVGVYGRRRRSLAGRVERTGDRRRSRSRFPGHAVYRGDYAVAKIDRLLREDD